MNRPTRQTAAGQAYLDLQNRARRERRTTQELLTLYVLERWLARLAVTPHAGMFVLKGGLLLAVFDARRPTADADLLARNLRSDPATIANRVREIAEWALPEDDGVTYLVETITAETPRRRRLRRRADRDELHVSTATVRLKLDINVGDPVTPAPTVIDLPSQRFNTPAVPVLGYPVETVLAEKISTAIALGDANTRVRDYVDIYALTGRHAITFTTTSAALNATAEHRHVAVQPLSQALGTFASLRQSAYDAFRRRLGVDGTHLPESLADVVAHVTRFADPLAGDDERWTTWDPSLREWRRQANRRSGR
ncbi:MAG TPA: nucleotidyl transferase AbiEii/AbiGii toxin family protein [Actinophytocola sp.]|nr:nucleotidyl transferase AbiEii/AbiGii toxin family protein [Actinophytocola sp.]